MAHEADMASEQGSPGGEQPASTAARRTALRAGGWYWLPLAGAVLALDQWSKAWMTHHLAYGENVTLLPVLSFTLRFNTGAAFSMLAEASGWQRWLFTALAVGVGGGILVWMQRLDPRRHWVLACSLSLILAGAIGNLIDRLRLGHVIDFILAHWKDWYFPAFNVADSAITIGAGLMLLDAFVQGRHRSH
jgi:signal peptidase II